MLANGHMGVFAGEVAFEAIGRASGAIMHMAWAAHIGHEWLMATNNLYAAYVGPANNLWIARGSYTDILMRDMRDWSKYTMSTADERVQTMFSVTKYYMERLAHSSTLLDSEWAGNAAEPDVPLETLIDALSIASRTAHEKAEIDAMIALLDIDVTPLMALNRRLVRIA